MVKCQPGLWCQEGSGACEYFLETGEKIFQSIIKLQVNDLTTDMCMQLFYIKSQDLGTAVLMNLPIILV